MALVLCGVVSVEAQAQDGVEAVLYDTSLSAQPIVLLELDGAGERLVYYDAAGERVSVGFDAIVRLTFPSSSAVDTALPVLATVDGQRIVGRPGQRLRPAGDDAESVAWRGIDGLEMFAVSLDDLAWVVCDAGIEPPAAPPADDVLVLATGERLSGFVDALGVDATRFVIGDAVDPVAIAPGRVSALIMSNAWSPPEGAGIVATFASGSRLRCALGAVDVEGVGRVAGLRAALHGDLEDTTRPLAPVRLGDEEPAASGAPAWPVVTQLDFQVGPHRLVALASLAMTEVEQAQPFGVPVPARLTPSGAVALHAGGAVSFDLPTDATRFAASITLAIGDDIPQERHAWAGCVVVVSVGETELARETIDADHPTAGINLALPEAARFGAARTLTVRVEEGVNGPILDRIELRSAEVLVSGQ